MDTKSDTHEKSSIDKDSSGKDPSGWIAEVSHELRLPIANLRLLVETLMNGASEDPDVCKRMLSRAHQEVERLQNLVTDLLSIEQVSSSRNEVFREWNSLLERARYAVETTCQQADEKGVKIMLAIEPEFKVYANPQQLDQVFLNLIENAIKFTPKGGTVKVCSGPGPGSFSVIDTGIGIPTSEIPRIFQRFYRVDRSQNRGSSGLGLSIVKHIVDLHGAKIKIDSKVNSGSTFQLEFPGPSQEILK